MLRKRANTGLMHPLQTVELIGELRNRLRQRNITVKQSSRVSSTIPMLQKRPMGGPRHSNKTLKLRELLGELPFQR